MRWVRRALSARGRPHADAPRPAFPRLPGADCSNIAFVKDPDGYWIEILTEKNAQMFVEWGKDQPAA